MSIKIDLYVDDKKYKVLDFHFGFFQDSDYTGLPVAKTNAYPFQFTLEATKDITFFEWAAHSTMQKRQVKIVFSPISGMGKSTVIELLDVNCLRCDFCYRSTGKAPALEHIDLHPATIIRDGRVLLQRHWAVTDPAMLKMAPVQRVTEDTTPKISVIVEIESISDLHEGSNNQGDGGIQDGMIYGMEYEFKIKKYRDDSLPSEDMKKKIIWEYSYKNDNDELITNVIESSGETFKLKIGNLEMLGREISISAYLGDQRRDGKLDVFCHNRFRYFDRKKIKNELNKRKEYPELANQSRTPTCGMASIFYILAKKDFNTYKRFILNLHRTGVAKCNSYNVDVINSEHLLKMNPVTNSQYPRSYNKMPYIDWIPFSCVRDQENDLPINYNGEMSKSSLDEFSGATLPHEIKKLMKEILGFKTIINDTNLVFNKDSQDFGEISAKELKKLQDLYLDGYEICLFINTNMINNIQSGVFTTMEHWVVFEGIIGGSLHWDEYEFKIFTWGGFENVMNNPESFRSNYYGYVAGK